MKDPALAENRRAREERLIVYPVYSRRSRGLSIGINLYPDGKCCNFDCKYCEVFPHGSGLKFSLTAMERGLYKTIAEAGMRGIPVKDISFSGNGEPTLSPDFAGALRLAAEVRDKAAARAELVVISNATGLLRRGCFELLRDFVRPPTSLKLWLKLDAGGEDWFKKINGCEIDFHGLSGAIKEFSLQNECVIQTMHCAVDGAPPPVEELCAWADLTARIAGTGNVSLVQIYGKARPSPHDPSCSTLPPDSLEERADALRMAFETAGLTTPVEVYE